MSGFGYGPGVTLGVAGDLLEDVVVLLDEAPRRGADARARIVRRPGGSATNVACTAAGLGAVVRLVTAVGDDPLGRRLVADVAAAGVEVRARSGGRTGTVVVVVEPGGQRTMYPDRAAAAGLRLERADLAGLRLLHVTGYGLLPPSSGDDDGTGPEAGGGLLDDLVALAPPRLSVDVSSTQVIEQAGAALQELLTRVGPLVVFANEDEADALGWRPGRVPVDGTVVIKRGPRPALVTTGRSVHSIPAEPVGEIGDTTGAGDAFAGGYLVAVLAGSDPVDAVRAGHRAAADRIRRQRRR